ncbi:unnamed protein product [Bursaphelenchus xylophilus]|uniref:(pine wood nematode) hypothetical protein n=1 Tax=Bursaphelenchus xylophilus TaxID=6326 RepID=F2VLM7_BURXY|nr:ABC transporter [Bursaphelenchus xylophilus]ADV57659.1 ABC transporter [Bursaphelenchus xylophilus]CAD5233915.1 unnamed protein product [Bursaphelenchus xylophilus]CAG9129374.1 unnamed protein product [Bursaphelenchus xylophilus]
MITMTSQRKFLCTLFLFFQTTLLLVKAGEWLEPRLEFSPQTERGYSRFTNDLTSAETEVFLEVVSNEHGKADKMVHEAVVEPRIVKKIMRLQTENFRRQGMSERLISLYMEMVRQGSGLLHMRYPQTWREQAVWEQSMKKIYDKFDRLSVTERAFVQWQNPDWYALIIKRKPVPLFRARRRSKGREAHRKARP